ncbi:MAG: hypothetical protein LUF30_10855, partial [Lachnospiraceae bacterium]|nr:hypothetical protein [Lachnospiraceae bacterium]
MWLAWCCGGEDYIDDRKKGEGLRMHEEKTVIDQRNKVQKNQEQKNQERICEYSFKEPEALRVAEALAENMETPPHVRSAAGRASDSENASRLAGAAAAKKQGEYTVDDYLALP